MALQTAELRREDDRRPVRREARQPLRVYLVGAEPWPKLFQNLRSSCESELANTFPLPVVTKWLGNTPSVALRHYVDPTDAAFTAATNWIPSGIALQNPVQSEADTGGQEETAMKGTLDFSGELLAPSVYVRSGPDDKRKCMGIEPTESVVHTPHRF